MSVAMLAERLAALRRVLVERGLAALVVPSSDAHISEYVRPCDMRRQALTGFTGSAGTAVVTAGAAALWTDGRYWAQAAREAPTWTLMRDRAPGTPTVRVCAREARETLFGARARERVHLARHRAHSRRASLPAAG